MHQKLVIGFKTIRHKSLIQVLKSSFADEQAQVAQMNHPVSIKLVTILTN